ncbi:hypothetical protein FA09DRAFT_338924 [Tilletiopsis washingtonensis]|jgi:ribosomal protein L35|uniref:50S ribosomal protein L35 n=1 Tax=Tilletiopsis washingtonensis TaxID=58919 RepID=A0A316ZAC1_9BASI|nr:hypothetical protein FA09DRAFT_338924 [Tilletiopsis washingtonensis]PWN97958.1 hypothetical protein FA09DRAFT_338924 [Tilletiopsis washingtonensis]
MSLARASAHLFRGATAAARPLGAGAALLAPPLVAAARAFSVSALAATWGGGKQKTHSGASKRFRAVGKQRTPTRTRYMPLFSPDAQLVPGMAPIMLPSVGSRVVGPMFKRGLAGKQHLNQHMHGAQKGRLRGTAVHRSGKHVKMLRRLLGPRL